MKRLATVLLIALAGALVATPSPAMVSRPSTSEAGVSVSGNGQTPSSYSRASVMIRMREGYGADPIARQYGSTVLGAVPEIRLYLLGVPSGYSEVGFARWLGTDERMEFAEPNAQLQAAETRQSSMAFSEGFRDWSEVEDQWAFPLIGVAAAQIVSTGDGETVAVLDTGVDLDHPALADHLLLPGFEPGVTTVPGDDRAEQVDTNGDGTIDGALGHGTHIAGIIVGIAPDARILPVRVLDSDGVGYAFDVARGLVAAVENGASVANLSLGMPTESLAVDAAVDHARAAGVVVVAPAGNSGTSSVEFPAALPSVLAVAGTDTNDERAWFSNSGDAVDVCAPAVGILSTYVDGQYAVWSGTSMAAPFASGIAALVYQRLGARGPLAAARAIELVREGAQALSTSGPEAAVGMGSGRVNAWGTMRAFLTDSTPPGDGTGTGSSNSISLSGVVP